MDTQTSAELLDAEAISRAEALGLHARYVVEGYMSGEHKSPSRGFAATLAAAPTVVAASGIGLPISTTHTLVGAVLGVGMARGIAALNLSVVRTIFVSWVITLPAGAILSIVFFYVLRAAFGG